uniref:NADH dehydrogenase [ubiquinone] iron-sulfur protein 8, mitochondrial-like n=1 Tax=Nicotiana tabacum TaxID=4097 RepID=A0A1S4C3A5_TOBAC|nr:PREDICTED: NADH dehydrogenase [ubiquinone] iron-sulfur protein 8, mitochondrial-like [Nicotiana tabacum]XP_018624592.1 NADH dehydrogenase [ubiquinone] iron-sulfur protein 8, mitochondrial-like [Nicotiana tomentosiformis]
MAAILARKSLYALRSRQLVLAGQAWQGTNACNGTLLGTRTFATKHSFSTDKGLYSALLIHPRSIIPFLYVSVSI